MRVFLILLALIALFATGWHAAFQGTDARHMKGAPQIERQIHRAAIAIVANAGGDPVEVRTSGRHVLLTGPVESAGKRDMLVARIGALPLVTRLTDEMTVLDRADPYTLEILKAPDGGLLVTGFVPNRRAEDRLLAEARGIGGSAGVTARLKLAVGVPDGNWTGMVSAGLEALGRLNHGRLAIEGEAADLEGEAADDAAAAAVEAAIAAAPMGRWTTTLTQAPPADGFVFAAAKPLEGPVVVEGHAPDEAARDRLLAATAEQTGREVTGTLKFAVGMPGPAWPDRAAEGLPALALLEQGRIELREWSMRVEGTVDTDEDYAALSLHLGEDWEVSVTVRNPTPHGNVDVVLTPDGRLTVKGLLPRGLNPEELASAMPEADLAGVEPELRGRPSDWSGALDGMSIILPRFEDMEARILGKTISVRGLLKRGFGREGVHAALRSATGPDWEVLVTALERRPFAELTLSLVGGKVELSGVLPVGLDPEAALAAMRTDAAAVGLAGGGDGEADNWRTALDSLADLLSGFDRLEARLVDEQMSMTGLLRPGHVASDIRAQLTDRLPAGWDVEMTLEESDAYEGDRRTNLRTGAGETFRSGHWLPDVSFPVSAERCGTEIDSATSNRGLDFDEGAVELGSGQDDLLDRLAAIAIRCLNGSDMRIEISGHTASVGNDAGNRLLSERRAMAVARALVDRGVRAQGIVAVGRGEEDPIATNDTTEGRRQNERIAFRVLGGNK